jgi:RNA polymerase sigma-70 factor, ECF subfamily
VLAICDEQALIRAWSAGDERAFEQLFRRHEPSVRKVCYSLLRNRGDAEEATQETFLKACKAIARTAEDCDLGPWLKSIARNVCIDQQRARMRRPVLLVADPCGVRPATERGPEEVVAGGDPRMDVVLEKLAPQHRDAVELRFVRGLSHVEMAGVLAKSPGQVKALVHRARARLSSEWTRIASPA